MNNSPPFPVALAIFTWRPNPDRSGATSYRVESRFVVVSSTDEATGIGVRIGREKFPSQDGWSTPEVAVTVTRPSEIEAASQAYKEAVESGVVITETEGGISFGFPESKS